MESQSDQKPLGGLILPPDIVLVIFSHLPGCHLYHKTAVLNKQIRSNLPTARLLDQTIVISMKSNLPPNYEEFTSCLELRSKQVVTEIKPPLISSMFQIKYALDLAKVILLEPTPSSLALAKWIFDAVNFRNAYAPKKTGVGLLMFG